MLLSTIAAAILLFTYLVLAVGRAPYLRIDPPLGQPVSITPGPFLPKHFAELRTPALHLFLRGQLHHDDLIGDLARFA